MGCCKLVGEKKNNKVFGAGSESVHTSMTPSNFETMGKVNDPSYKNNLTPDGAKPSQPPKSSSNKTVAMGVDPGVNNQPVET